MYGRAEFDLLKLRVLHQDQRGQERKKKRKNRQEQQANRLTKPKMRKDGTTSQCTTIVISKVA
jgi:hypothetical protein